MSTALRSLFFDIMWNLRTGPLQEANRMTDQLRDNTQRLGGDLQQTALSANRMGREMRQMFKYSSDSARETLFQFRQMNSELQQFARNSVIHDTASAFSVLESSVLQTNAALQMMGFGRTKTQAQAFEAQLYNMANVRMDNLRDQINLTEKAIKEMKASANAAQMQQQIALAERMLAQYKDRLKEVEQQTRRMGEASGYVMRRIFGKDVFIKPFDSALSEIKGRIGGYLNADLAYLANKTYSVIDGAAKKIVGTTSTIAEQRLKITQLTNAYRTLGMTINTFVTPAIIAAGIGLGILGAKYEEMSNRFQAQTLIPEFKMPAMQNVMVDTQVSTGAAYRDIGEVFSYFRNQLRVADSDLKAATETAFSFAEAWGRGDTQGMIEMYSGLTVIMKELKVTRQQAADMLAISLRNNQGDVQAATQEILDQAKAYREVTAAGKEGSYAFERMRDAMNDGAIRRFGQAFRQMGAALLELFKQLEPTLTKIANGITVAAKSLTEFFRAHPQMASFAAHALLVGGAVTIMIGAFAPLAGLLIWSRGLFQMMGQSIRGAMLGGVAVANPAAAAIVRSMTMMRNAIMGLPRIIMGFLPALLSLLRAAPMAILQFGLAFVRMNPMFVAFSVLGYLIQRNWAQIGPILSKMWEDVKMAFAPVLQLFQGANGSIWPQVKQWLGEVADIAGKGLVKAFQFLAPIVHDAAVAVNQWLGGLFKSIAAWWRQDGPMIIQGVRNIVSGIVVAFSFLLPVLKPIFTVAKIIVISLWESIKAVVTSGIGIIQNVIGIFGALFTGNWSRLWQNVKSLFVNVITFVWNLMSLTFLGRILGAARAGMGLLRSAIASGWNTIRSVFVGAITAIRNFFTTNFNSLSMAAQSILNGLRAVFWWVWDTIKQIVTGSISFVRNIITNCLGFVRERFSIAWTAIKNYLSDVFASIRKSISDFVSGAMDVGKKFLQNIIDGFKSKIAAVVSAAQEIWNSIKRVFSGEQTVNVNVQANANGKTFHGSHATGLWNVPFDGYIAELHKGEMVLTARQAQQYRQSAVAMTSAATIPRAEKPSLAIKDAERPQQTSNRPTVTNYFQTTIQGGRDEITQKLAQYIDRRIKELLPGLVDEFFASLEGIR
jgi:phage-related protein